MSEVILKLRSEWPFVQRVKDPYSLLSESDHETLTRERRRVSETRSKSWVLMQDGRIAYIHHGKPDGKLGVRPVHPETGEDLPNTSAHWSEEDRMRYPEEHAVHRDSVTPARPDQLPKSLRN